MATVREQLGIDGSIEQGDSGEFTVWSDGELVFSKHDVGRFPEDDEVIAKLASTT